MKKLLFVWAALFCITLWGCSWEPAHRHTFGDWTIKESPTCAKVGSEERICAECQETETRPIAKLPHDLNANNICKTCKYVDFDPDGEFAELGVFSNNWYTNTNSKANHVWDVKVWGNMVYRGAGDYDINAGTTPFLAFNKDTQCWEKPGNSDDQAIQRFVEIGGKLYAPGIDANGSWALGNFYVLEGDTWTQVRNLPNGLHNFDMIEFDGKIFAGLGTETVGNTVAVSADGGKTFQFLPLYQDGKCIDTAAYQYSRTYEFAAYGGKLYALVVFQSNSSSKYMIFRYEEDKMVYQGPAKGLLGGTGYNRNFWSGKLEKDGICYLTADSLFAITDFADNSTWKRVVMPQDERVIDALLYDGVMYVLCGLPLADNKGYTTIIYQSATGTEGSFTEVVRYDYPSAPCSFDYDGTHFYIGTGGSVDAAKIGMLLRVKA